MKPKLLFAIFALASIVIFSGCDKITNVNFTFSTGDITFRYGPDTVIGNVTFCDENVTSKLDSIVRANGGNLADLKSLKLKSCVVAIDSPAGANYNAVSSFQSWLSTPTLPNILIASLQPVPANTNVISMAVTDQEISNYIKTPVFSYKLTGTKSQPITQELIITVHLEFDAVAGPL